MSSGNGTPVCADTESYNCEIVLECGRQNDLRDSLQSVLVSSVITNFISDTAHLLSTLSFLYHTEVIFDTKHKI